MSPLFLFPVLVPSKSFSLLQFGTHKGMYERKDMTENLCYKMCCFRHVWKSFLKRKWMYFALRVIDINIQTYRWQEKTIQQLIYYCLHSRVINYIVLYSSHILVYQCVLNSKAFYSCQVVDFSYFNTPRNHKLPAYHVQYTIYFYVQINF